jgi:hypothetical protein
MKKNMGGTDRMIRRVIAIIAAILYFTGTVPGTLGIILLVVAGVFLLTSFLNFCTLYTVLGINTKNKDN